MDVVDGDGRRKKVGLTQERKASEAMPPHISTGVDWAGAVVIIVHGPHITLGSSRLEGSGGRCWSKPKPTTSKRGYT